MVKGKKSCLSIFQLIKIISGHQIDGEGNRKKIAVHFIPQENQTAYQIQLYVKWHYNQLEHISFLMTSPYSTRSRRATIVVQSHQQPLKEQELSPKTTTRPQRSSANTQSIKLQPVEKPNFSTPQITRSKRENLSSFLSNPEHLNLEHSSSSHNDSLGARQKSTKKQTESDRVQPNLSSIIVEQNSVFLGMQMEKQSSKKSDDVFINEKKSYRTQFNRITVGVPYRKCHSTMEQKVVGIINKIKSGKQCQKEIETLLERTRKISIKEMMNRFFVSGLHVILRLVKRDKSGISFDENLQSKIEECIQELKQKIESQLDCPKAYEVILTTPKVHEICKEKLIVRAYKILRKKQRDQEMEEAQRKAIETTQWFIENNHNDLKIFLDELIRC